MNKAAQKFAQVTALNGVRICHRSIGEWTASKLEAHKEGLEKLAVPALVLHGR